MKEIHIQLSGSKSITNRLLILNALYPNTIRLINTSKSQDSQLMQDALSSNNELIDIHHAGTAMRFLTAYYSIQNKRKTILTGSHRMKERPIEILVTALQKLGANISYLENNGYPPLEINGKELHENKIKISSQVSSQYITALCLIGTQLKNGLNIELEGKVTSFPYINMTLNILTQLGIKVDFYKNNISIAYTNKLKKTEFVIESDWSSASYHYSLCALGNDFKIRLKYLFKNSLQADRKVEIIYKDYFGVNTEFINGEIILSKIKEFCYPKSIQLDMNDCPDIAQTVAVTAFGLRIPIHITGLETLKIKETDRLHALKTEIEKCGGEVFITDNSLKINSCNNFIDNINIKTYNDHRMAMSFVPLKLLFPLQIEHPEVVKKSYPEFWEDIKKYNFFY